MGLCGPHRGREHCEEEKNLLPGSETAPENPTSSYRHCVDCATPAVCYDVQFVFQIPEL
jgi:hypothetical protein